MKRPVWLLIGVAVAVAIAWFALRPGGGEVVAADLVEQFPSAKEKRPNDDNFSVGEATIGGVTKPSVFVKDSSRLVYTVVVPDNGELRVDLGILEQGWTMEGDGVLFRIMVGAGAPPEVILSLVLNPFANPNDRAWLPLALDLSEYAGETIDLFFNTNASPPSRPPVNNTNGDFAVWGAPRVVSR